MKNKLLFYAVIPFFLGCAELQVETPLPIAESPEVIGETWKLQAEFGVMPARLIEVTSNGGSRPPDFTTPLTEIGTFPNGKFESGIGSRFQLGVGIGLNGIISSGSGSSSFLTAKFQLLGEPRVSAKISNLSLALFGNWGRTTQSNSGDQATTFGSGGYDWSGNIAASHSILGVSLGYRVREKALLFIGYGQAEYSVSGAVEQQPEGADPGGTYGFNQSGTSAAYTLGIDYQICSKKNCSFMLKYSGYRFEWESLSAVNDAVWGASFILDFK